jgi:predicted transcriptional regulator
MKERIEAILADTIFGLTANEIARELGIGYGAARKALVGTPTKKINCGDHQRRIYTRAEA